MSLHQIRDGGKEPGKWRERKARREGREGIEERLLTILFDISPDEMLR